MTANRAVLFSGTTFVIAMFGMFHRAELDHAQSRGRGDPGRDRFGRGLGNAAAGAARSAGRARSTGCEYRSSAGARSKPPTRRGASGVGSRSVLRRPALAAGVSVALLLAAASPIFGMHVGTSGPTLLPSRFEARQGFESLQRNFPGATANPVEIVVATVAEQPPAERALARLRTTLASNPRFGPGLIERSPDGEVAMRSVPVRGDPSGDAAVSAVRHLRSTTVPAAFEGDRRPILVGGRRPRTSTTSTRSSARLRG